MQWIKFKDFFHESWWDKIQPFIESKECDQIYEFLKKKSKEGVKIAPSSINTYRAFKETSLDDLRCVFLSYCPYANLIDNKPVADGLAFSCSITEKLQPSLDMWYDALEQEFYNGLHLNYTRNPDLTFLANQGVLLWNSALTTEINTPGKHQELWMPFTKYVITTILNNRNIPFVVIGNDAQIYTPLIKGNIVFELEHPAFAAREKRLWESDDTFLEINHILDDKYINWFEEPLGDEPPF